MLPTGQVYSGIDRPECRDISGTFIVSSEAGAERKGKWLINVKDELRFPFFAQSVNILLVLG